MSGNGASDRLVDGDWLEAHLDDPDLRIFELNSAATDSYDAAHIPGAIGWQWKEWCWDEAMRDFPSPEEFARRCASQGVSNDSTVVVYGDPLQYGTYGWWVFTYLGHPDVRVLDGGKDKWLADGRPVTTGRPAIAPATYTPNGPRNDAMRARRDEVLAFIGKAEAGDGSLLDHRTIEEYRGERVNMIGNPDVGAERAGRIPGAQHLFFEELLNSDRSFKSVDELRAIFAERGATGAHEVVSYCRLSHRATLCYFAMTQILGWDRVRSYDGSWTEWGSLVGMPIER
jgi:thiosulfate/3-mercaptopyruvate sulfurtransferase